MNILIKLMSIVSLVLAPTLAGMFREKNTTNEAAKQTIERSDKEKAQIEASNTASFQ
jgi:K(+)-stimulated pyrophosphate-energized sodium pump